MGNSASSFIYTTNDVIVKFNGVDTNGVSHSIAE